MLSECDKCKKETHFKIPAEVCSVCTTKGSEMENQNSQYNQDVAEIFAALAKATKSDIAEMGQSEVNGLAAAARALTANTPQVY